jgi:hypothetical protein
VYLCGYPGETYNNDNKDRKHDNATFPYEVIGGFVRQNEWAASYRNPSYGGMSGSPFRYTDDQKVWKATAILSCSHAYKNDITYGCLLTEHKLYTINNWKIMLMKTKNQNEYFELFLTLSKSKYFNQGQVKFIG